MFRVRTPDCILGLELPGVLVTSPGRTAAYFIAVTRARTGGFEAG